MSIHRKPLLLFALFLSMQVALGFEINPSTHRPTDITHNLKSEYRAFLSRLTRSTHEDLTTLSLQCATSATKLDWCDMDPATNNIKYRYAEDSAIFGTRWNDDPNNFFRVDNEVQWFFWLKAAGVKKEITPQNPLEYRSHYGDLQFLHGMGSSATSPLNTRDNVIDWLHFSYDVATHQILPSETMSELAPRYRFARFFTQTSKGSWTVKKLFTNVGDVLCKQDCPSDLPATDDEVASLALGASLHTIQDSLSDSHVDRVTEDGASRVAAWLDYRMQDSNCHGDADKDVGWLDSKKYNIKPAIAWGAWVARNAMLGVPWKDLESDLSGRMFTLSKKYRDSDAGSFTKEKCPKHT